METERKHSEAVLQEAGSKEDLKADSEVVEEEEEVEEEDSEVEEEE